MGPLSVAPSPEEAAAALGLAEASGLGPARIRFLIDRFGSARAVLARGRHAADLAPFFRRCLVSVRPASQSRIRRLHDRGVRLAVYGSPGYPDRLGHLHDPPPVLYLAGPATLPTERAVAVVGTRRATPYGRRLARQIAGGLATAGWTVVSGMARGIDGTAHAAALDAGGVTVGVLGSGLDFAYPASNRALYRRVCQAGLLTTEFAPAVRPAPGLFPRRNRIIAALADAVVVVQAAGRSGALITAGHALDVGREVLAVPGPVGLAASEGVHALLRDGAAVATSASDIIDLFSGQIVATHDRPTTEGSATRGPPAADVPETTAEQVLRRLSGGPATADEILRALDRPVPEALALIGGLELEGFLRREADGRYVLSQPAGARA